MGGEEQNGLLTVGDGGCEGHGAGEEHDHEAECHESEAERAREVLLESWMPASRQLMPWFSSSSFFFSRADGSGEAERGQFMNVRVASRTVGERRAMIMVGEMIKGAACKASQAALP